MSVDSDVVLGRLIRSMRAEAGLSCLALARAIGIDPVRLVRLEAGNGLLLFSDLLPIVRACGSSLVVFGARFEAELEASEPRTDGQVAAADGHEEATFDE